MGNSSFFFSLNLQKDNNEGYDCLIIPQPSAFVSDETATKVLSYSEYCGTKVTFKSFVENENPTSICCEYIFIFRFAGNEGVCRIF